jgi:hypothetical protein
MIILDADIFTLLTDRHPNVLRHYEAPDCASRIGLSEASGNRMALRAESVWAADRGLARLRRRAHSWLNIVACIGRSDAMNHCIFQ